MYILSGAWGISLMFKNKLVKEFFDKLKSIKVRISFLIVLFILVPSVSAVVITHNYYADELVSSQMANLQVNAAVMAGEFSGYDSLVAAQKAGVYSQMRRYSTMNSIRIRIVDKNYKIVYDSYSMDEDKNIINENVINTYHDNKAYSYFNEVNNTMESVVPIASREGKIIGVLVADMDTSNIDELIKNVRNDEVTVIVAALFVIIAVAFLVVIVLFHCVEKVAADVEYIANGHNDKRLKEEGWTEVKAFARNFNSIMDKNSDLDKNRQEFVSNVSHELKTPLTSIKVLADSLNMQEDAPAELYKEFMQDITNEIDRENKIIEDLLSLVKMDKSSSSLNITSVNLNELLEIVLKRLKPIAQKKNVEILFESFRPVVAQIDESKITQVISNLVENAIKYNKFEGWVHVSLNADYQYFYVRIEDSGIGIPKESQDKIFNRFYRVDKARSRETGGTGLGLAIVQEIILMHKGIIKLYSEENQGTTFTVRIPLNYVG